MDRKQRLSVDPYAVLLDWYLYTVECRVIRAVHLLYTGGGDCMVDGLGSKDLHINILVNLTTIHDA